MGENEAYRHIFMWQLMYFCHIEVAVVLGSVNERRISIYVPFETENYAQKRCMSRLKDLTMFKYSAIKLIEFLTLFISEMDSQN